MQTSQSYTQSSAFTSQDMTFGTMFDGCSIGTVNIAINHKWTERHEFTQRFDVFDLIFVFESLLWSLILSLTVILLYIKYQILCTKVDYSISKAFSLDYFVLCRSYVCTNCKTESDWPSWHLEQCKENSVIDIHNKVIISLLSFVFYFIKQI